MASEEERRKREGSFPLGAKSVEEKKKREEKERKERGRKNRGENRKKGEERKKRGFPGIPTVEDQRSEN